MRFIKTWPSVVVLLATWLSGGRVVPLLQTADGIESEFASDVDATQSMSPNVTDWSRLFVLRWNFWFASAINLSQHQFEKKKKKMQESFPYGSRGSDRFVLLLSILLAFELLKGGIHLQQ